MKNPHRKQLSLILQNPKFTIKKTGLPLKLKDNIDELKQCLYDKNDILYEKTNTYINRYLANHNKRTSSCFNELTLWQMAVSASSLTMLKNIMVHDKQLLGLFEDLNDIILLATRCKSVDTFSLFLKGNYIERLCRKIHPKDILKVINRYGAGFFFDLILEDNNFKILVERVGHDGLLKIANNDGSKHTLDLILNTDHYETLLQRITKPELIKIGSKNGARNVLEMFLNKDIFHELKKKLGKKNLIKIASQAGAKQVLYLLLDKEKFNLLVQRIGKEGIFKIAPQFGAKQVLDIILDTDNFNMLQTQLGDRFIKISCKIGAKKVLDMLMDKDIFESLEQLLGKEKLLYIASKGGASQTFELFLKTDIVDTLVKRLGKDEMIKIACNDGSRQVFDLILKKSAYDTLIKYLGKETLVKISSNNGSRQVLNFIIDPKKRPILLERLGQSGLAKVARPSGARQVLDLLFDKKKYDLLVQRLGIEGLIKIASRAGARQTLELIINNDSYATLLHSLGKETLIKIGSQNSASQALDIVLNHDIFQSLISVLGKDGFTKIACSGGAKTIFELILDKNSFQLLRAKLGLGNLINIASNIGSKPLLDLLLNKSSFDTLLKRLGIDILIQVASKENAKQTFNMILDTKIYDKLVSRLGKDNFLYVIKRAYITPTLNLILDLKNWLILKSVFDLETLIKMISLTKYRYNLLNLVDNYETLSTHFSIKSLYKYTILPIRDRKGLIMPYLDQLKSRFSFTESEILVLAKLAGRFIPQIIQLFFDHEQAIKKIFYEISAYKNDGAINKRHEITSKECIINLIEMHQFCITSALSIDEIHYLKQNTPYVPNNETPYIRIKRLLRLTGSFPSTQRMVLWQKLFQDKFLHDHHWVFKLSELSLDLREWFIETGYNYLHYLIFPEYYSALNHLYKEDMRNEDTLIRCLESAKIRKLFSQTCPKSKLDSYLNFQFVCVLETSCNFSVIGPKPPVCFDTLTWVIIIMHLYDAIESFFSFKHIPKITFNNKRLLVNIPKQSIQEILDFQNSSTKERTENIVKPSLKRQLPAPLSPDSKKIRLSSPILSLASPTPSSSSDEMNDFNALIESCDWDNLLDRDETIMDESNLFSLLDNILD